MRLFEKENYRQINNKLPFNTERKTLKMMKAVRIHPGNGPELQKLLLFADTTFEGNPRRWEREKEQEREYSYLTKWNDLERVPNSPKCCYKDQYRRKKTF